MSNRLKGLFFTVPALLFSWTVWAAEAPAGGRVEIEAIMARRFSAVEEMLKRSRTRIVDILQKADGLKPVYPYSIYTQKKDETFSDHLHYARSNFFIPVRVPIDPYLKKFIQTSEHFEDIFAANRAEQPSIGWQYVIEYRRHGMRFYPWFDADNIMGSEIDWSRFQFYTLARNNKNYEKMTCSDPSLDVGGLGYVITCALPIRLRDSDYGLIGVDLSMSSYFSELRPQLGDSLDAFSYLTFPGKDAIVLKPRFHNFLLKNVMNMKNLDIRGAGRLYILGEGYSFRMIPVKSDYSRLQLMEVVKDGK